MAAMATRMRVVVVVRSRCLSLCMQVHTRTHWMDGCVRTCLLSAAGEDAAAATAVSSLVKLCLQTIGKRLKHFVK